MPLHHSPQYSSLQHPARPVSGETMVPEWSATDAALLELVDILRREGYRFTTVTPTTHARVNARPDNAWARTLGDMLGWSRPFLPELPPPAVFELLRDAELLEPAGQGWRSLIRVSSLGDRLFVHSAWPTTASDAVFFGPDTYRFVGAIDALLAGRPAARARRAVDIGCGAGPGAISVALGWPDADVLAVDINESALHLTRVNAAAAGARNLTALRSDLLADVDGRFDLIVANPPYLVDPMARAYRHGGGPLGLNLALAIVDTALHRLVSGGTLLLYTGVAMRRGADPFRAEIERRLTRQRVTWTYREMDPDIFGEELESAAYAEADRIAAVVLTIKRANDQT